MPPNRSTFADERLDLPRRSRMSVAEKSTSLAELGCERLPALGVDVGDRDARAAVAEGAHDRLADQCRIRP